MTLIDTIYTKFNDTMRISIFNIMKTNNPVIDALLSTFVLTIISYIIKKLSQEDYSVQDFNIEKIKGYIYKKNTIILEGKKSSMSTIYSQTQNISSLYSNRFKAFWYYIINNMEHNTSINQIKESFSNYDSLVSLEESRKKVLDIFIVSQKKPFKINDNIYVNCFLENDDVQNDKITTKTEKIIIEIYSYTITLHNLKKFIDNITTEYLNTIKTNRYNKKFIYILNKTKDEDNMLNCWNETEFLTTRSFNNIFFDEKKELIEKLDFFMNNKKWYETRGIPYTIGIGLHGPPGTGKTSLIKAIANYTNRHIILLSLKIIQTKQQLESFFFENTYNSNNEKGTITFDNKIIVIEDIDCIGDIVLKREEKYNNKNNNKNKNKNNDNNKNNKNNNNNNNSYDDNIKIGDVIKSVIDINNTDNQLSNQKNEDRITLDDILNLSDGIRETSGRILIISSNHYHKLDPALIRPGRIDISHELKNASHNTIMEMYEHFFGVKIDMNLLKKVKENFYSPAEIVNIYISCKKEKEFMKRLMENKKVI
jgi:ATP-dependent 26S proteasome regulatory subunit